MRLPAFDYRSPGPYFVSICTQHREHRFGGIVTHEMRLNPAGQMVADIWASIPDTFPSAVIDGFVIMPNHVHGTIWFEHRDNVAHPSLGDIIG